MSSKRRMQEFRIPRNGSQRHRSVGGGTVIGDYVDASTGERVLTVKVVSVSTGQKPKKSKQGAAAIAMATEELRRRASGATPTAPVAGVANNG